MNNDTQKIRIDLQSQLRQAEQAEPSLENAALVRWLKSKLSFLESAWYPAYKAQNNAAQYPAVQFERLPDEELL